ncbi:MAG: intradiol ring-cleavage dioxygenase [Proteobacteria bacterium]|nr:intradiol ring-cleavage dioxygenase [Pseudomonadota bacterium]MDA0849696.1 intradiol ring-cleavage dioxygenase [Pseudomonadota bacterium]MDA1295979.1 intradiol ring-cleavage dioxygenase [Pseudomonadota bacterium]
MTDTGYLTEDNSSEVVAGRIANTTDPRFKKIMTVLIHHLHAAVKEIEPSQEEWFKAIQFLTATGHMCDDWRQEFVLLSDVLGVSMLVDAINNRKPSGASESTVLGPFHVENAPELELGSNICLDQKGDPMLVKGSVLTTDGTPIPNAKIDVWQANDDGFYDVQQKGHQPDFNLRGIFRTDNEGRYWFNAVRPKFYPIPDDGPVGKMLSQMGRHPFRPAHLHFIIEAEGFETLTTHIFDPDDPYLHTDAVFGVKKSLIAKYINRTPKGSVQKKWEVAFDFFLIRTQ